MHDTSPTPTPLRALWRPALVSAGFFMVLTGLGYPLLTTGAAQVLFPAAANGSLVTRNGSVVGSALLGQNFVAPGYFHPRPSATTGPDPADPSQTVAQPYNAALSGASNLGPTSRKLVEQVSARAAAYRRENRLAATAPVPVDAVTASGSGLDPDISPANAELQIARVAAARNLPVARIAALVATGTTPRQLGVLGDPRVNVLALNLALDALAAPRPATR